RSGSTTNVFRVDDFEGSDFILDIDVNDSITIIEFGAPTPKLPDNNIIEDRFTGLDDDDVTSRIPDTVSNGNVWTDTKSLTTDPTAGTGTIQNNKIQFTVNSSGQVIDSGYSDCIVIADFEPAVGVSNFNSIIFRHNSDGNMWNFNAREYGPPGDIRLLEISSDTVTVRDSASFIFTEGNKYELKVVLNGSFIECYVDDAYLLAYTSSQYSNEVNHGLLRNGGDDATRLDNFIVRPLTKYIDTSDSITITENVSVSISVSSVISVDVSDTLTITESTTTLINQLNVNVSDSITVTENNTVLVNYLNLDIFDTLTITESTTSLINYLNISNNDTITLTENSTVSISSIAFLDIDVLDTITITENTTVAVPT
ncbi:MAG: hypothetical protein ACC656_13795, partial [Candidatus Heimdallarchaeota archaeon]